MQKNEKTAWLHAVFLTHFISAWLAQRHVMYKDMRKGE